MIIRNPLRWAWNFLAASQTALETPRHDGSLDEVPGFGVSPGFAGPAAWERQSISAHMVLAEDVAWSVRGRFAFAGEIIKTISAGFRLIA